MKKIIAILLVLMLGLLLFAGCGGAQDSEDSGGGTTDVVNSEEDDVDSDEDDSLTDMIFYKAEFPEGYFANTTQGNDYYTVVFEKEGSSPTTKLYVKLAYNDIDVAVEKELDTFADAGWTQGPDVEIGAYNWKTIDYSWNDMPSRNYYVQADEKETLVVMGMCIAPDDPDMMTFLSRFVMADNFAEAQQTAWNTKLPEDFL